jgi:hypothetical protein
MRKVFHRTEGSLAALAVVCLFAAMAFAQDGVVAPNAHLKADGIPPISAALAAKVAPYTEFRPRTFASWHPEKREMIVATRATNTAQLFRIGAPLASPAQLTDFSDPVRFGAWWPPRPDTLVFTRDTGGNEQNQIYREDPGGKEPVLLTDPARTHRPIAINRARNRLLVASTDLDKTGRRENPTLDLSPSTHWTLRGYGKSQRSRHRLVCREFFVRRPATRVDRVQIGQRNVRVDRRCRLWSAPPRLARRDRCANAANRDRK